MGWGWVLAELGNKAMFSQLGLKLGLNFSLEDFPEIGGGWLVSGAEVEI